MNSFSTRRCLLLGTTHLLAIAAGVVLFRSIPGFPPKVQAPPAPAVSGLPKEAADPPSGERRPESPPAASVCEAAWRTLAWQGLPLAERRRAGALILRDWIQADWRAALDAVMKENSSDSIYLGEFLDQFVRDPIAPWEIIEKKTYGARTDSLKIYWREALLRVSPNNPARQKILTSLPEPARRAFVSAR
ncbi:hypothetical protein [Luteolibacter sp. Populi]|uniref:hypothetical protein n=1 Tax=Luteolibacter sp. Populi TaxID=3230487 RepID=UPI0034671E6E